MPKFICPRLSFFMPKEIIFNKYQVRSKSYHWQQISHNIFLFNSYVMARYQQVLKQIPSNKHLKILDIGCGDGVLLSLISKKSSAKLFGVDLDQTCLDYASTKVKAKFYKGSATKLPFKNNYFGMVIATEIIEHLNSPQALIKEAYRVLKPKAKLIITTPNKLESGLTDKLHVQEFSKQELFQILKPEFKSIKISGSHPLWLKNIYTKTIFKYGKYHFDLGRWLINLLIFLTGYNPFKSKQSHPSQLLVIAKKNDR